MQKFMSLIRWKIILISIGFGILFWIIDSFLNVVIFHNGAVVSQLFTPRPYEIYVRSFTMVLLIIFGAIAQYMVIKHKKAEEALRESEERYRSVVENIGTGISVISPDMKIMALNGQMKRWFPGIDVSKGPVCHETFNSPPRKDICSYCPTCKTFADGQTHEAITDTPAGDGIKNYRVISSPIKNAGGNVVAAIEMVEDITERRKMEEQIFQITHDWEDTFNTITDMITVHDRDFNIIHANKAAEKILGLPILNVSAAKCYEYYHGTGCPPEGCPSCECLMTGMSSVSEIYEPHLNMFIEIRAIPRFDSSNNLAGLIHVVRDITERKKLEEQLRQSQKMEAVGQLAGGIAHDFNNILTAVIGYATILKMRTDDDDPSKVTLEQILAASEKGANLTQSLLAFSRQQTSNPEPVDVNELIRGMENLILRAIGKDVELKTTLAGDLTVMADHIQIDQVLMNLCTNARDAMPDGGILTIETGLMKLDMDFTAAYDYGRPGTYAVISVSDTGIGIDEKTRGRIFEPFYTTKEVGKGSGLGLSIVYGIIKQHNGYITCFSEPGRGSTFRIYLPISRPEVSAEYPEDLPGIESQSATVLLAEDEQTSRELTKQVLEKFGYNVIEAADGKEALSRFIENRDRIDIIILDVIMPKMNGKEVYERIRKIRPDVKVILTSGYPADFIQKQAIINQGINFMAKPLSPAVLVKKVKEELLR